MIGAAAPASVAMCVDAVRAIAARVPTKSHARGRSFGLASSSSATTVGSAIGSACKHRIQTLDETPRHQI